MKTRAALLALTGLVWTAAVEAQNAFVRGTVIALQDGRPVQQVMVVLQDGLGAPNNRVPTDSLGRFLFEVDKPGRYRVTVENDPASVSALHLLDVKPGDDLELTIRLDPLFKLESINVTARSPLVTERVREFRERAEHNNPLGRGRIFTREDVLRLQPRTAEDLVNSLPTARCRPEILVDNTSTSATELRSITPANLEGVEFYTGEDIPVAFRQLGRCGVVLVWTRSQPDGMRRMGFGRMLFATLFAVASFVLLK